ncbi:energy transducer TonB [Phenylobacterium sp.]|uniref:energy transducer TonB n=1 Tax=Phenylobacterium sp. TaxID=1871053 RepID=UPI00286CFC39|nr:energy transducer TonB [Phenylobacterium sp.]
MIRQELSPAMVGSVLLHASVAALLMVSWNFTRDLKVGAIVPVTLVARSPAPDPRPAEPAPVEQAAQAAEPTPDAPLESTAPPPAPKPAPPVPTPKPAPTVAKPMPAPAPARPAPPARQQKALDLDALSASVSKMVRPAPARPSSAAKAPARPGTSAVARPALGASLSTAAMNGLTEELQRRWNPNCEVEGGREVQVRVSFVIGAGGQVVGDVASQIKGAHNAVAQASAERAVRAVYAAAPFRALPREFYGDRIAVNFNAREACS